MRINVFSRPGKLSTLPGVLGFALKSGNCFFSINCHNAIVREASENMKKGGESHIVLPSAVPVNFSGLESLSVILKNGSENLFLHAPKLLHSWLKALITEKDYSSETLRGIKFETYDAPYGSNIFECAGFRAEYIPGVNAFFDYIFKFSIKGSAIRFFYAELADLNAPFPDCIKGADILILNLACYPAVNGNIEKIDSSMAENNIKAVILPFPDGIKLITPSRDRCFQRTEKERYVFDADGCQAEVYHEKDFREYHDSIFPVLVEDENSGDSILLGMGLGAVLRQRLNKFAGHSFSSALITSDSYAKVFCCIDLASQLGGRPLEIICGQAMSEALNYFKIIAENSRGRNFPEAVVSESVEDKSTRHILFNALELLMIPIPGGGGGDYIARIYDTLNDEYLLYTENLENSFFIEKNLKGIDTFIVATRKAAQEKYLIEVQKRLRVERLIILLPGRTEVTHLEVPE
jgi:hypothetical protein